VTTQPGTPYARAVAQLGERDFRAVLDFLGEAYDAQDRAEFRAVMLPGFRRLVPSDYAAYNELLGTTPLATIAEPALPDWSLPVWAEHAGENPLLQRYLATRDGRAVRFSDVAPASELRRLPIFEHLYTPLGLSHQVAFALPSTPELTIAMALSRGGSDYSDRDVKMLELTRPHLIQAYRAAELRERLTAAVAGLQAGLDADGTALLLLDGDGSVALASEPAAALLGPLGSEPRVGLPPGGPLGAWLEGEESSGTIGEGEAVSDVPGDDAEARPQPLLVRRLRSGAQTVVLLEPAGHALSVESLALLGLSPREAAVLHGLAVGSGTPQLAIDLGISPRTVAKHVQRINAKLGVTSRAQAIATAWAAGGKPLRASS
jgi:DNA-binding CsgD family transcriptional regulator